MVFNVESMLPKIPFLLYVEFKMVVSFMDVLSSMVTSFSASATYGFGSKVNGFALVSLICPLLMSSSKLAPKTSSQNYSLYIIFLGDLPKLISVSNNLLFLRTFF